jgi:signal transduction histidine kinase
VSRLSFRGRLFLILLTVSAIPVGVMTVAGIIAIRTIPDIRPGGPVPQIDSVGESIKQLLVSLEGVPLAPAGERAKLEHQEAVSELLTRYKNAQAVARNTLSDIWRVVAIAALVVLVLVAAVVPLLSRQLSAPLDEVVDWTGRIERREPLPSESESSGGIPEFAALRDALRDLAQSIEQGRRAELEAERLRTFGEVARRVAHEMKNPLTPIRLAVLQMRRGVGADHTEPLEVIAAESARLEAMAREFAELGRLPETVPSPVDLRELLEEMLRAAVPETMSRRFASDEPAVVVEAQYDPLRRAFSNVFRNAVEACRGEGEVRVELARKADGIHILIADTGPGIPADKRQLIFQPYFTDKRDGTGLGLAIVRQTVEQHGGTITVTDTPGGGATFLIRLPA